MVIMGVIVQNDETIKKVPIYEFHKLHVSHMQPHVKYNVFCNIEHIIETVYF